MIDNLINLDTHLEIPTDRHEQGEGDALDGYFACERNDSSYQGFYVSNGSGMSVGLNGTSGFTVIQGSPCSWTRNGKRSGRTWVMGDQRWTPLNLCIATLELQNDVSGSLGSPPRSPDRRPIVPLRQFFAERLRGTLTSALQARELASALHALTETALGGQTVLTYNRLTRLDD